MPSTVADVLAAGGLVCDGAVRWGTPVPQRATGVYVVALTGDPRSLAGALPEAPIAADRVGHLLAVRPELRLDGARPTAAELSNRLDAFWVADEVVLYIGLAGQPLRTRVRQYYTTALGAKRPHAGGWPLKTLSVLDEMWVHYATTPNYDTAEEDMLKAFAAAVSPTSRDALHDRERVAPFANLRTGTGLIKRHGITGATGDLNGPEARSARTPSRRRSSTATKATAGAARRRSQRPTAAGGREASQRVTALDLAAGRVRFPRAAKQLFPSERSEMGVVVRGRELRGRWDPRVGPDRERSGLLAFGRGKLAGLVDVDDVLTVSVRRDGRVELE